MQYINLGKTGLKVSRLCLGMMTYGSKKWREYVLEEEDAKPFVGRALEAGINFFDTADVYSLGESERITGNLLKDVKRQNIVVATKVHGQMSDDPNDRGLSRKHILDSIDNSLKRLQMDYVDLYQIHRWDPNVPIEETMEALNDVVRAGKARYIGASSMYAWQFAKALHVSEKHGWAKFVSMQNHYNLIYREEEREMIPLCKDQGIGLLPWSPMARGYFSAERKSGGTVRSHNDPFGKELYSHENNPVVAEQVADVAKRHNVTGSQIALAWMLNKPHITSPIIGSSKIEHLDQAVAALEIKLSEDDVRQVESAYQAHPVLGHS